MSTIKVIGSRRDLGPQGHSSREAISRVQDLTAPAMIISPGGSPTIVNPGDSISSKITAAGVGGTLFFTKGAYNLSGSFSPLQGQKLYFESAAGFARTSSDSAIISGGDQTFDFLCNFSVADVEIYGGVWEHCGNASSNNFSTAILISGGQTKGNCVVSDAVFKDNYHKGIGNQSPNNLIRRCYFTNNGRYGFACTEAVAGENYTGTVIENCRWSFNNSRLLNPGGDASGCKFTHHPGIVVRDCWVHDNYGFGIWPDFAVADGLAGGIITGNVVEKNRRSGIFQEGTNGGLVSRNYLMNNGWDTAAVGGQAASFGNCVQIRITNADSRLAAGGVRGLVEKNYVDFNMTQDGSVGGALLLWQHDGHPEQVHSWDVLSNQFWFRAAQAQRIGGEDTFTGDEVWDNSLFFDNNDYRVVNTTTSFWKWAASGGGVAQSWASWQGTFGQDVHGSRTVI